MSTSTTDDVDKILSAVLVAASEKRNCTVEEIRDGNAPIDVRRLCVGALYLFDVSRRDINRALDYEPDSTVIFGYRRFVRDEPGLSAEAAVIQEMALAKTMDPDFKVLPCLRNGKAPGVGFGDSPWKRPGRIANSTPKVTKPNVAKGFKEELSQRICNEFMPVPVVSIMAYLLAEKSPTVAQLASALDMDEADVEKGITAVHLLTRKDPEFARHIANLASPKLLTP